MNAVKGLWGIHAFVFMGISACDGGGGSAPAPQPPTVEDPTAPFQNVSRTNLPQSQLMGRCMDADHGDVDGDGDIDLALAQEFATNLILVNNGFGEFSVSSGAVNGGNGDNEDVRLEDIDGDAALDMLSVHEDDRIHALLFNDGSGTFTDMSSLVPVMSTANATELIDLNNDRRVDILLGNAGQNLVLLQQTDGSFVDDTADRPIGGSITQDLLLLDVDGDSDRDLFVVNETANRLFINDGSGFFTDESATRLPFENQESREADAADVDNDGDLDIIVANVNFMTRGAIENRLLLNDSTGVFTSAPTANLMAVPNAASSFTIKFVDLDADGDPDILSPRSILGQGGEIDVWINDGAGRFSSPNSPLFSSTPSGSAFDVEVLDVNGDGLKDLYICNRTGPDQLFIQQ